MALADEDRIAILFRRKPLRMLLENGVLSNYVVAAFAPSLIQFAMNRSLRVRISTEMSACVS